MPRLVTESTFRPACFARRPATQRATRKATATSTPYVCRNEIWKISGYIRRLPFGAQHFQNQQSAADHNGRIRQVERGPMIFAYVELQEVRHAPPKNAI